MNIYTNHANYILGFHGCDKEIVDKILNSTTKHLEASRNDYDWLGSGVYFWLNDPVRALEWAKEKQKRKPKEIKEPAVIGAIIDLKVCLNLSERECLETLREGYSLFSKSVKFNKDLKNFAPDKGGFNLLRKLDCAVINYTCNLLEDADEPVHIDTVMGIFQESDSIFDGSDIRSKTHTQVCVRNEGCIMGYFLPRK